MEEENGKPGKDIEFQAPETGSIPEEQAANTGESKETESTEPTPVIKDVKNIVYDSLHKAIFYGVSEGDDKYDRRLQSFQKITAEDFKPEEIEAKRKGYRGTELGIWKPVLKLEQLLNSPEVAEGFERKSSELSPEELSRQIVARYQLVKLYDEVAFRLHQTAVVNVEKGFSKLNIGRGQERAIQLGAYLVAPGMSSRDFLSIFKIYDQIDEITAVYQNEEEVQKKVNDFFTGFWQENGGWKNQEVLEFGGSDTVHKLEAYGAKSTIVDAGHSGYTANYHVANQEAMVDIQNYDKSMKPAGYDLICSANTLDWESGIEAITDMDYWARRNNSSETITAIDELTLIFYNALRQDGFMVHDEMGLDEDLCDLIGIKEVTYMYLDQRLGEDDTQGSNWSDERIHIYKKTGEPQIKTVIVGNKIISYDHNSGTWKQTYNRKDLEGDYRYLGKTLNLTTQEFIFGAKRDIEFSRKYSFSGDDEEGRQNLTTDGVRINCQSEEVDQLLGVIEPINLAGALSDESRANIEIWRKILAAVEEENTRSYILEKRVPEELRDQLSGS